MRLTPLHTPMSELITGLAIGSLQADLHTCSIAPQMSPQLGTQGEMK